MAEDNQPNPYIVGIEKIEGYYQKHEITVKTAKHAHAEEIPDEILHTKISVPGYKYYTPRRYKDFVVEFRHDGVYHKISYTDVALDLYQKIRFNPEVFKPMVHFIKDIGFYGEATNIPEELFGLKNNAPLPLLVDYITRNLRFHRLSLLDFGIPINYYPKILYWLFMNEEINYAPKNDEGWGGRRTPLKRLIETIYIAAISNLRGDKKLTDKDRKNVLMMFVRIINGKNSDFVNFPPSFRKIFSIIDTYEHLT